MMAGYRPAQESVVVTPTEKEQPQQQQLKRPQS